MRNPAYWFYILFSLKDQKLYKGSCSDIGIRFLSHSLGSTVSTKNRRPFVLIYIKGFDSKKEALEFERFSKTLEGGSQLRQLLKSLDILNDDGILSSDG